MLKILIILAFVAGGFYPSQAGVTHADVPPEPTFAVTATRNVWVTAYSSAPEETDETPYLTASGRIVEDGVLAANFLSFGTKVRIPAFFGDKVFVVADRMHERKTNVVDVWMPSKQVAVNFGAAYTQIEILE